jgi:hypothetical protein
VDVQRKIQAIKRVREITGAGLAEAKEMVESLPSVIMKGMFHKQAEELTGLLKESGMEAVIVSDPDHEPQLQSLKQISFDLDPKVPRVVHRFVHEFEDGDVGGDLDPPVGATIRFDLDGKNIWLSANRAGWLHLARICAEIGLSEFAPGYHFHRTYDWRWSQERGQEVSFELSDDGESA